MLTSTQIENVVELYIGYFTRAPEFSGLEFWKSEYLSKLNTGKSDEQALTEIADSFYTAALQYSDDTGYSAADTPAQFIQKIYANVLLRTGTTAPNAEEISYWENELATNKVSMGGLVRRMISDAKAFAGDAQWGYVAETLANRKEVAEAYASSEEGRTLSGSEAVIKGKAILSTIDSSTSSKEQALGIIADKDSKVTTVFKGGDDLSNLIDGTTNIDSNIYTSKSTNTVPNSVLVANGANLTIDGVVALGGAVSSFTVRGEGSSAIVKASVDDTKSTIGRFSGDSSQVNVSNSATLVFENDVRLADHRVRVRDEGEVDGVVGGTTNATLNISGGSSVIIQGALQVADNYARSDFAGDGSEKTNATVSVSGSGSSLTVQDWVNFGGSKGAGTLEVLNGASVVFEKDASFGRVTNLDEQHGGEGRILIKGAGSKLDVTYLQIARASATGDLRVEDHGEINAKEMNIAEYSGSTASVAITRGGIVNIEENLNVGYFAPGSIWGDGTKFSAVKDGASVVNFEISAGAKVITQNNISMAFRYSPEAGFTQGTETSTVNLTVTGAGSLLESKLNYSSFGLTKGGVANVKVLDGGKLIFGDGVNFGRAEDDNPDKGGEGNLTISGAGSSVSFQAEKNSWFGMGEGENAIGSLTISDGGALMSGDLAAGLSGGKASVHIDGGSVTIARIDGSGYSGSFRLGEDFSANGGSTLEVSNGGVIAIDGLGGRSPSFRLASNEGSEASAIITGMGSKVALMNGNPRENPGEDGGVAYVMVAGKGTANLIISDGAEFTSSKTASFSVATDEGSTGTVTIDGAGSVLNYGGALFIGAHSGSDSNATVNIINGATVNNTGIYIGSTNEFSGVFLLSNKSVLTVDAQSILNSNVILDKGQFNVGPAIESVSVNGDFSQYGGNVNFEIGDSTTYDKLSIIGVANLDGTLHIELKDGFSEVAGDSFQLLSANSISIGSSFSLDIVGLDTGLDAQLQVSDGVASLVIFDTSVDDFAII